MEYFDELNGAKVRDTEAREEIAKLKEGGGGKLYRHELYISVPLPTTQTPLRYIVLTVYSKRATAFTRLDELLNDVSYLREFPSVLCSVMTELDRYPVVVFFNYNEFDEGEYSEIYLDVSGVISDGGNVADLYLSCEYYGPGYNVIEAYTPKEV